MPNATDRRTDMVIRLSGTVTYYVIMPCSITTYITTLFSGLLLKDGTSLEFQCRRVRISCKTIYWQQTEVFEYPSYSYEDPSQSTYYVGISL